jgi:hypothetical protein
MRPYLPIRNNDRRDVLLLAGLMSSEPLLWQIGARLV